MTLFSFIFAMLLEQFRPVRDDSRLAKSIERLFLKIPQIAKSVRWIRQDFPAEIWVQKIQKRFLKIPDVALLLVKQVDPDC